MNDREHYPDTFQDPLQATDEHAWLYPWFAALIFLFAVGVVALYELR